MKRASLDRESLDRVSWTGTTLKIDVLKNFAALEPFLIKLQTFFYRTPTVAASVFLR